MSNLRILIAHSEYRQRGGEDVVADQEAELLIERGHQVRRYTRNNHDVDAMSKTQLALQTLWSSATTRDITRLIDEFEPDVVHVHNTLPLVSPSVYWAAARRGIPVVQTLHNFRLLCPQAMLLRNGKVCEDCVGGIPWRAVARSCYRESAAQSAVLAGTLLTHRLLGTYRHKISRFIALNEFCRRKFIQGGLPADKFVVKPNFANPPKPDPKSQRDGALFVGRLSREKGIDVLLNAMARLPDKRIDVIGTGPEQARVAAHTQVTLHGWLEPQQIFSAMHRSAYLVLPSVWYENSPRTLIEALGCGLPVIASRIGALAELIDDGRTGLLFDASSPADLARCMQWADSHPDEMRAMGIQARHEFEQRYTPERNYQALLDIYSDAIESPYSVEVA
jgi:glycosyltransferase involved in cell wall biosynthesis